MPEQKEFSMLKHIILSAVAGLFLTVPALAEPDLEKGGKIFKRCAACHAVGAKAKNKVGPVLNGVVGRSWGIIENYKYSKGKDGTLLKIAEGGDKVWDVATLDAYLTKPKDMIPKGKMAFPGLKKDEDRENVIGYLATFDADGNNVDPAPVLKEHSGI